MINYLKLLQAFNECETLKVKESRRALLHLTESRLQQQCVDFVNDSPRDFAMHICGLVKTVCATEYAYKSDWEFFFDALLLQEVNLSPVSRQAIEQAKAELTAPHKPDNKPDYRSALDKARGEVPEPPAEFPDKTDKPVDHKNIIINFDLTKLIDKLQKELINLSTDENRERYQGVFAFFLHGHPMVLEKYVLERIQLELREITGRTPRLPKPVTLTPNNLSDDRALEASLDVETCRDLLGNTEQSYADILLMIWNRGLPADEFFARAHFFQNRLYQQLLPEMDRQRRCFITLWAGEKRMPKTSVSPARTATPISLPLQRKFNRAELTELYPWIRMKLEKQSVPPSTIDRLIANLRRGNHNSLYDTYFLLQTELKYLWS